GTYHEHSAETPQPDRPGEALEDQPAHARAVALGGLRAPLHQDRRPRPLPARGHRGLRSRRCPRPRNPEIVLCIRYGTAERGPGRYLPKKMMRGITHDYAGIH